MLKVILCLIGAAFLLTALLLSPLPDAAQASQERKAIKLDPSIYDAYVGQYELTPEFVITVRREEGGLSVQATGQPKFEIFAESETKFFLTVVDAQITFVKNEKGEVTHLILHQGGVDQKARNRDDGAHRADSGQRRRQNTPCLRTPSHQLRPAGADAGAT
jgi:hypothetical protein